MNDNLICDIFAISNVGILYKKMREWFIRTKAALTGSMVTGTTLNTENNKKYFTKL